jgi:hypothetical protein
MAGLVAAKAQGRNGGRPAVMGADKLAAARARRERGESATEIARRSASAGYRCTATWRTRQGSQTPEAAGPEPVTASTVTGSVLSRGPLARCSRACASIRARHPSALAGLRLFPAVFPAGPGVFACGILLLMLDRRAGVRPAGTATSITLRGPDRCPRRPPLRVPRRRGAGRDSPASGRSLRSLIVTTEMYRLLYGRPVATAFPSDAYSSVTVESSARWVLRSKQRSRKKLKW